MEVWKVMVFIKFCINYASMGYLCLKIQQLICLYEECLVMAEYFQDFLTQISLNFFLGELYQKTSQLTKRIKCLKSVIAIAIRKKNKQVEAFTNAELSSTYEQLGKHSEAFDCIKKCQSIALEIGDETLLGRAYGKLGLIYLSLGENDEGINCCEKYLMITIKKGDKLEIGRAYWNLGCLYSASEKYYEAINHFEKSLYASTEVGFKPGQLSAYINLGYNNQSVSNFDKAIEYYNKSLDLAMETNSKKLETITYMHLGDTYHSLANYQEAIKCEEKALSTTIEIGDKKYEGRVYAKLGLMYHSLCECDKAIDYNQKALKISIMTGDGENELTAYVNLGSTYLLLSKYYEAVKCLEKALDISKENGYKQNMQSVYRNLGSAYEELGKYADALPYLKKNLNICIETGDREGEGWAYRRLCGPYRRQGKHQEVIDNAMKSLAIAKEIGDKESVGQSYKVLGIFHLEKGNCKKAIEYFERSLEIALEIGNKQVEGCVYLDLGDTYAALGEFHKAIMYFEKSIKIAILLGVKRDEQSSSFSLGSLYYILGMIYKEKKCHDKKLYQYSMNKSKEYFKEALQCCEWTFDHLQDRDDFKISMLDKFISTYKYFTIVLIETQETEEALLVSERGRARALSDLLCSKYSITIVKTVPLKYVEVETVFSERDFCVFYMHIALQLNAVAIWVLARQKPTFSLKNNALFSGNEVTSTVFAAYDQMKVREIAKCENRSLDLLENSQMTSGQLKGDDLDVAEESSMLSGVRGGGTPKKESTRNEVENSESQLNWKQNQRGSKEGATPLEILFNDLVAPVLQNLTLEDIVIIPDGPLNMVPFAALRDPHTGLFLSEMKRIRFAPSLTTLKILQDCPDNYHSKKGALVVGDPDSGEVMYRGEKTTFPPLPKAQHEAKIIGSILNVAPLIGLQATKDVIQQRLREGVAVIHIAAHGNTEGEIALAPCTSTASGSTPEEQDYMLTMKEVQETGIRAQLVVLSCCHSGRGEIKAEGIMGISRAFLAAGARAVVASLWAIDDDATLNFMISFYMHLKMGESASKSLQQAMKDMRQDGYDEPRYWAPFFLIGDDVTISV